MIAFDIEIAKAIPDTEDLRRQYREAKARMASKEELDAIAAAGERSKDWNNFRPLGISCAAIIDDSGSSIVWHGAERDGLIAERMTPEEVANMFNYLYDIRENVVTWNGASFDFKVVYEEANGLIDIVKMKDLVFEHKDLMFHCLCYNGWPLGLGTAALGMGLQGKTEGMSGAKAPVMWASGRDEQNKVLEYVVQDVRVTSSLYLAMQREKQLRWTSKSGKQCIWRFERPLSVREAMNLPLPDTAWMTNPITRESVLGWAIGL